MIRMKFFHTRASTFLGRGQIVTGLQGPHSHDSLIAEAGREEGKGWRREGKGG